MEGPIYKPKILQGHSRPIKDIKFAKNEPYLFSASSDRNVIQWNYITNEKVFTYNHNASVNIIAITSTFKYMITGDSTGCIYIWDINSKTLFHQIEFDPKLNVRSINISTDDKDVIITLANRAREAQSFIAAYSLASLVDENQKENKQPPNELKKFKCSINTTKYVASKFFNNNKSILVSREDGCLELIDYINGHTISSANFHKDIILSFDVNETYGIILTTSKDGYACIINLNTFQAIRQFHPENPIRNLNAGTISLINNIFFRKETKIDVDNLFELDDNFNDYLEKALNDDMNNPSEEDIKKYGNSGDLLIAVISGGQDSKFVTTTDQKEGGFDIFIYNALNGELLCSFVDHFGPVNSLASTDVYLASGAEDATVRIRKIESCVFKKT